VKKEAATEEAASEEAVVAEESATEEATIKSAAGEVSAAAEESAATKSTAAESPADREGRAFCKRIRRPQLLTRLCACAQGITEWTTPSKSRRNNERNERKEASAPIDCGNGYGALLGSGGNEGIVGGKATSKATRRSTPSATNSCSPPACAREARQVAKFLFFKRRSVF